MRSGYYKVQLFSKTNVHNTLLVAHRRDARRGVQRCGWAVHLLYGSLSHSALPQGLRNTFLLAPGSLLYKFDLFPDLQSWTGAIAADFQPVGAPAPNGDSVTVTVALRVMPCLCVSGNVKRHIRIAARIP